MTGSNVPLESLNQMTCSCIDESSGSLMLVSRELGKRYPKKAFKSVEVHRLMKCLNLVVVQRQAYRVTTQRNLHHRMLVNRVNQGFNPSYPNQVWAGDMIPKGRLDVFSDHHGLIFPQNYWLSTGSSQPWLSEQCQAIALSPP
jgi:hypothetical protein